jgi:hypothetical protein
VLGSPALEAALVSAISFCSEPNIITVMRLNNGIGALWPAATSYARNVRQDAIVQTIAGSRRRICGVRYCGGVCYSDPLKVNAEAILVRGLRSEWP